MKKILLVLLCASTLFADTYPQWIRSGLKVIAYFEENSFKEGYGLLIDEGLGLVSSAVVYDNKKPLDIILHNNEILGNPVACLSHARIIALDDNVGLALLKLESFTDIYCNILPKPNFRESHFIMLSHSILYAPLMWDKKGKISYFEEKDWLNFGEKQADLETLKKDNLQKLLGMPLFEKDIFVGMIVEQKVKNEKNKITILKHNEILEFLCGLERKTNILLHYKKIENFCKEAKKSIPLGKIK